MEQGAFAREIYSILASLSGIGPELIKIFCIVMVAIFVINLLLLRSTVAAITSTVACLAIVSEIYGLAMTFLMFNVVDSPWLREGGRLEPPPLRVGPPSGARGSCVGGSSPLLLFGLLLFGGLWGCRGECG